MKKDLVLDDLESLLDLHAEGIFFLCATRSHCGLNIFLSKCPSEWAMSKKQKN